MDPRGEYAAPPRMVLLEKKNVSQNLIRTPDQILNLKETQEAEERVEHHEMQLHSDHGHCRTSDGFFRNCKGRRWEGHSSCMSATHGVRVLFTSSHCPETSGKMSTV